MFTTTESPAGGTLLYFVDHLSYKPRPDIKIYISSELETTFIEIMNPNKSNIIAGSIYKHASMDFTDFSINYINNLLHNVSKNKTFFLLGDSNVNWLNYNNYNPTNEFLDSFAWN